MTFTVVAETAFQHLNKIAPSYLPAKAIEAVAAIKMVLSSPVFILYDVLLLKHFRSVQDREIYLVLVCSSTLPSYLQSDKMATRSRDEHAQIQSIKFSDFAMCEGIYGLFLENSNGSTSF